MTFSVSLPAKVLAVLLACVTATAASATGMPLVAELFTSQGCSSCPPADALLGELAREPDVIALAFHVQYWDGLGWADRFGMPAASNRQQAYVQGLRLSGAYTPQLILNAEHNLLGSNRAQVQALLPVLRRQRGGGIAIAASLSPGMLDIALPALAGEQLQVEVLLLAVQSQADTAIGRGENSGRTLREFNIVRAVRVLDRWYGSAAQYHVSTASLPRDADQAVILLQETRQGAIRGALQLPLR
jgi:hypothetical protein